MSTFSAWWRNFRVRPEPRQITWVCGTELVLIDEVVSLIRSAVGADDVNSVFLNAQDAPQRLIWNELRQLPMGSKATRLTVVVGAERLLGAQFIQYVKDRGQFPRNYVVFVSSEPALSKVETSDGEELHPALGNLRNRGTLIECRPFTVNTAKYAVEWVKEKANIRGQVAAHLLNRATGDLRLVRDVLNKLSVFDGEITLRAVNEILEERPKDTFLGALFSLDRKTALKALKEIPSSEYSKTLGLVDARLELAGLVHDLMIEHKSPAEIAKAAGSKSFLVPEMLPVAKHYDFKRRLRIRALLASIDEYKEYGVPEGSMEALTALW